MRTLNRVRLAVATESATDTVAFVVQLARVFAAGVSVSAVASALWSALNV